MVAVAKTSDFAAAFGSSACQLLLIFSPSLAVAAATAAAVGIATAALPVDDALAAVAVATADCGGGGAIAVAMQPSFAVAGACSVWPRTKFVEDADTGLLRQPYMVAGEVAEHKVNLQPSDGCSHEV